MSGKSLVQWQWHLDGRRTGGVLVRCFSFLNSQAHSPCTLQPLRGFISLSITWGNRNVQCVDWVKLWSDSLWWKEVRSTTNRRLYLSTYSWARVAKTSLCPGEDTEIVSCSQACSI